MARSKGLKEAVRKAKATRKKYPNKYNHLKKAHRWSKGYMKNAFATVKAKPAKRKPSRKPRKKVGVVKKKKTAPRKAARKKSTGKLHIVKQTTTTQRVMAGRKRRKRKTGSIGTAYRRRSVGRSGGNTGLIVAAVGLGVVALMLMNKKPTTTQTAYQNLPQLQQTSSYTRNQQGNDLVNYAIAAGLAVTAIADLIDRLNRSDDNEVSNIYDHVNTTGDVGVWV